MIIETLPSAHDEKLAYLLAAVKHRDALAELLKVGAVAAGIRTYAESADDLFLTETQENQLVLRYGERVKWVVTVDQNDVIRGFGFSGFGDLMEALGIDLAGKPYQAG